MVLFNILCKRLKLIYKENIPEIIFLLTREMSKCDAHLQNGKKEDLEYYRPVSLTLV